MTRAGGGRAGELKAAAMEEDVLDEWLDDALWARALPDARSGPQRIVVPLVERALYHCRRLELACAPAAAPRHHGRCQSRACTCSRPALMQTSSHAWHRTATLAAQYVNCACNNHLLHASCTLCTAKAHGTAVYKVVSVKNLKSNRCMLAQDMATRQVKTET